MSGAEQLSMLPILALASEITTAVIEFVMTAGHHHQTFPSTRVLLYVC